MEFNAITGHDAYAAVVAAVMELGAYRKPRGKLTRDLGYVSITVPEPVQMLPLGTRPNLSTKIAAVEAIQLIGGFSDMTLIKNVAPALLPFAEEAGFFHGAYGRRIGTQVLNVVAKLNKDPDTRQAIVTLWDPALDNQIGKKDYPCTVALAFELHGGFLQLTAFMRSNDVWRGLPYDMFQFTQLQQTVARVLRTKAGVYRHVALSMHAYEEDWPKLEQVDVRNGDHESYYPIGIGAEDDHWWKITDRARKITMLTPDISLTQSELWYHQRLAVTS